MFCSCGPNLVILAWTRDKLSRGQASAYRTHRQTDAANDNTRRPKLASGKNHHLHIGGLMQDGSISSALAREILQYCTKPSIYIFCWHSLAINHYKQDTTDQMLFSKQMLRTCKILGHLTHKRRYRPFCKHFQMLIFQWKSLNAD